ncbi:MAG: tetratricopeptide repeat protein [Planctomycetes bacterium]|nr:tetratricopeptide repeat protein [Planctomycetota bacterium]
MPRSSRVSARPGRSLLAFAALAPLALVFCGCGGPPTGLSLEEQINLGKYYFANQKYDFAEGMFVRALDKHPKYPPAYVGLGSIYCVRGQAALAAKQLPQATQWMRMAEESYQLALQGDAKNVDALLGLGQVFVEVRRGDQAVPYLERALEVSAKLPACALRARYYLGIALALEGQYTPARVRLQEFLQMLPPREAQDAGAREERRKIEDLLKEISNRPDRKPS